MTDEQTAMKRCQVHEGLRLTRYRCPAGHMTIGYGHKITQFDAHLQTVSSAEAKALFDADWMTAYRHAHRMMLRRGFTLARGPRFFALVEAIFQMGPGNAKARTGVAGFRQFWAALKRGDFERAADEMRWSNGLTKARPSKWHRDTPARCEILARVMRTGADIVR